VYGKVSLHSGRNLTWIILIMPLTAETESLALNSKLHG